MGKIEQDNIWNQLVLFGGPHKENTFNFAETLMLLDLPIKSRNTIKTSGLKYTPVIFSPRKPESIKRKINRWKKLDPKKSTLKLVQEWVEKNMTKKMGEIQLIEIPTDRAHWKPIFFSDNKKLFLQIILTKNNKIKGQLKQYDSFSWKGYSCKIIRVSKVDYWKRLGESAYFAMNHPYKDLDYGLFEFSLLNGLNLLDITLHSDWRTRHNDYYRECLDSFIEALKKSILSLPYQLKA